MPAYYNEIDPYAAAWLRNLIAAGHIAPGDVDERSIADVHADDLKGYAQCHFFAGIGGWSYAARLAGYPDDRELWTGSCPCQPFSVAGKGEGQADERHLWPAFFALISARRPDVVMGEQVAAAVGKDWLDGVCVDLEGIGYAFGAAVVPACAVDAPHRRDRLWFVADCNGKRSLAATDIPSARYRSAAATNDRQGIVGYANSNGAGQEPEHSPEVPSFSQEQRQPEFRAAVSGRAGSWGAAAWLLGSDGKARRFEPNIRLLAHGVPARVGKLRAYGNAIVPKVGAEVIAAYMEAAE